MASMEDLRSIRALELIDGDPRPTFIVELETAVRDQAAILHPIYCNEAMQLSPVSYSWHSAISSLQRTCNLRAGSWTLTLQKPPPLLSSSLDFLHHQRPVESHERCFLLRVLATEVLPIEDLRSTRSSNGVKLSVENGQSQDGAGRFSGTGYPIWTDVLPSSPQMEKFSLTYWSATPLGPLHSWSSRLRHTTDLLLCDSR